MNGPAAPAPIRILALARLLPAGAKGEALDKLRKDLKPLLEPLGPGWAGGLDDALDGLEGEGAIARQESGKKKVTVRFTLAEEGRRLALEALGLEEWPAKTTWAKVQSDYLSPLALGRTGSKGVDLKAEILRVHYGLELGDRPKLKDASGAMSARLLGLEPGQSFTAETILRKLLKDAGIDLGPAAKKADPKSIGEALIRRELGDASAKKPLDLLATRAVGARQDKAAELAAAILRGWVGRSPLPSAPTVEAGPLDLEAFARRVVEAARRCPTGWFGDDQVYIAQVRRSLLDDPAFASMDDAEFKERLVEAHRARLLELGRADLVEAMDPAAVRESATPYLNAVYHFVRIEDQTQ